jgi:hypothetical protein
VVVADVAEVDVLEPPTGAVVEGALVMPLPELLLDAEV